MNENFLTMNVKKNENFQDFLHQTGHENKQVKSDIHNLMISKKIWLNVIKSIKKKIMC